VTLTLCERIPWTYMFRVELSSIPSLSTARIHAGSSSADPSPWPVIAKRGRLNCSGVHGHREIFFQSRPMASTLPVMAVRLVCLLFFLVTTLCLSLLCREAYWASTSKNWPTTNGVVFAFYETPQYRYTVSSRSYTNDIVSCNEMCLRSFAIRNSEKYSVRYPLQATVSVHYHPGRPDVSALETKFDPSVLRIIALILFVDLLLALGFAFGGSFRSRSL
jgi:hypothetical protein